MVAKVSAGLVMCRPSRAGGGVLLVHPGGPFFAKKDAGAWSIPKGLASFGEDLLTAAKREFEEELGVAALGERYFPLGEITQKGGKVVHAWGFVGDWNPDDLVSNTFELEWPPRSGNRQHFPEVDRAAFFSLDQATSKILQAQRPLLERVALVPELIA